MLVRALACVRACVCVVMSVCVRVFVSEWVTWIRTCCKSAKHVSSSTQPDVRSTSETRRTCRFRQEMAPWRVGPRVDLAHLTTRYLLTNRWTFFTFLCLVKFSINRNSLCSNCLWSFTRSRTRGAWSGDRHACAWRLVPCTFTLNLCLLPCTLYYLTPEFMLYKLFLFQIVYIMFYCFWCWNYIMFLIKYNKFYYVMSSYLIL